MKPRYKRSDNSSNGYSPGCAAPHGCPLPSSQCFETAGPNPPTQDFVCNQAEQVSHARLAVSTRQANASGWMDGWMDGVLDG